MTGYDEATPPPPRDPAEEAARKVRENELLAKLEALEARAAMTDDTPRQGPPCDHVWPSMGGLATHFRYCPKCDALEAGTPPAAPSSGATGSTLGAADAAERAEMHRDLTRAMDIARGRGTQPLPVLDPPAHVDDCSSDQYDAMRARLGFLEERHRDTVGSEQARELLNATVRLAERDAAIERVRALHQRDPLYTVDCDCPRPDDDGSDAYHDYEDDHTTSSDGDTLCLKQPQGADCGHCRDSYGDSIPWPCPTIAALDGPAREQP